MPKPFPYDGRNRPKPAYSSDAMAPEKFEYEFCDALMRTVISNPLWSMPAGISVDAARKWHGTFLKYMSFFAWKFPSWLMAVAIQCPYQDVRAEIIKDCVDEEVGDPEAGGRCHIDVLYEEAEAVGMKRQEIFDAVPTPPITACLHAWENLARSQHWVPAFAAIAGLEIIHSEPAIEARARLTSAEAANAYAEELGGTSFNDKLGVKAGDLVFLALHSHKDRFHGGGELSMLVKYANTRELQEESIWAARTSLEISAVHFGEINRLAAKAAGATELFASQNRASWL